MKDLPGKKDPYGDIIHLPRHVSKKRPHMPTANRAAQFAPFAALTGYDGAIKETARSTQGRIELEESAIAALDLKLSILAEQIAHHPEVSVVYFQPDERKDGGAYVTLTDAVKKIDPYEKVLVFMNGRAIKIRDILDMDGGLFWGLV